MKITIKDIARMANTSITTVSFYLNGHYHKMSTEVKERIKDIIAKTNYTRNRSAVSLRSNDTNIISVLVGDITQLYSIKIYNEINKEAIEQDKIATLNETKLDIEIETKLFKRLLDQKVSTIVMQPSSDFEKIVSLILDEEGNSKTKIVFLDSNTSDDRIININTSSIEDIKEQIDKSKKFNNFFIVQNTSNLFIREYRKSLLLTGFKKANAKFQVIESDTNLVEEPTLHEAMFRIDNKAKNVFWCNNLNCLFEILKSLQFHEIDSKLIEVITFYKVPHKKLYPYKITEIQNDWKPIYKKINKALNKKPTM